MLTAAGWLTLLAATLHVDLGQRGAAGEAIAPAGSPAAAQLAVQSARAVARLGDGLGTRAALKRCASLLERQSQERPPDHHFYFDGNKLDLYTGTALAWLGDPAAEDYARHAAVRHEVGGQRRRLTTAYLDLGLVLVRLGRPDEAAHYGVLALGTNHLVPSNSWRADELIEYRGCRRLRNCASCMPARADRETLT